MLDKIEALRKEPVHVRNRYAFWVAFCVTLLIALVWALSLPSRFATQQEVPEEIVITDETSRMGAVFASAVLRLREIVDTFRSSTQEGDIATSSDKEELDFKALIASSTEKRRSAETGTSTASSTATSTVSSSTSTATTTE
jgi:hypothetical protein